MVRHLRIIILLKGSRFKMVKYFELNIFTKGTEVMFEGQLYIVVYPIISRYEVSVILEGLEKAIPANKLSGVLTKFMY